MEGRQQEGRGRGRTGIALLAVTVTALVIWAGLALGPGEELPAAGLPAPEKARTAPQPTTEPPVPTPEPTPQPTPTPAPAFEDVLGEASTHVGGTASRVGNVRLAGEYLNGTVLAPGEVFSYLAVCGPYEQEKGYGLGAGYLNGKTVQSYGGGVCQGASTLYLAVLRANLEVVERTPHGYEPGYIAAGLDATVAGDEIDFRFRNNTDYPVKIEAYLDESSQLHVLLHGTDVTGIHGEPYSANRVVTQYAATVYEPSEAVPRGTLQKDPTRTAYNAVSAEAYLKLVDAQGSVVDTIFLHRDQYRSRDEVILYNPADAGLWNLDGDAGPGREEQQPAESRPTRQSVDEE